MPTTFAGRSALRTGIADRNQVAALKVWSKADPPLFHKCKLNNPTLQSEFWKNRLGQRRWTSSLNGNGKGRGGCEKSRNVISRNRLARSLPHQDQVKLEEPADARGGVSKSNNAGLASTLLKCLLPSLLFLLSHNDLWLQFTFTAQRHVNEGTRKAPGNPDRQAAPKQR